MNTILVTIRMEPFISPSFIGLGLTSAEIQIPVSKSLSGFGKAKGEIRKTNENLSKIFVGEFLFRFLRKKTKISLQMSSLLKMLGRFFVRIPCTDQTAGPILMKFGMEGPHPSRF